MRKGDVFEGKVLRMDFPNKGIIEAEGERIVVKNALPGQKIRRVLTKKRKGTCEGRLLAVLEPSPVEDGGQACPHSGLCGGCLYQGFPYEEQLAVKESQVRALLAPVLPEGSYVFEGIKGSPLERGYRNKMEFSFGDEVKGGPLALGMHKRGSFYDIVTTPQCQIVHPDFCRILEAAREYFAELGAPFFKKLSHKGYLRHLLVRRAVKTGEILVSLVTTTQTEWLSAGGSTEEAVLAGFRERLLGLELSGRLTGKFAGILHTRNDSMADAVIDEGTDILWGTDYFYEELLGLRFKITPFSFFQTNSLGAEVLYGMAREYVGETKGKVVFDLYSGTGTIAQILAPVAEKVVGVEIVEEAVRAAREGAAANGLANCTFLAGDVLKVVDELREKPDIIVVDPPRDGIHPKALGKIIDFGVDRMVYISCKPTSLARDLAVLLERGYRAERVCCVDMFPFTGNVETVVLLSKLKVDHHIEIELKMDELDLTAAESKATYDEIKAYVFDKYGLKVSQLYIAQVKRKCGIIERKNYNVSKKEDAKVPQCPPEKEAAIMDALKHFQMI